MSPKTILSFRTIVILIYFLNCVYPNPPCQRSLWEETEHQEKTHDFRQSVDWLFSHVLSGQRDRIKPTIS